MVRKHADISFKEKSFIVLKLYGLIQLLKRKMILYCAITPLKKILGFHAAQFWIPECSQILKRYDKCQCIFISNFRPLGDL